MKVLFTTNIPSPYRVAFFNELGKYCDLTVVFESRTASDRADTWFDYSHEYFRAIFLCDEGVGRKLPMNPALIPVLKAVNADVVVIGLYSSLTGMAAITYLRAKHIPFILSTDGGLIAADNGPKRWMKQHFISAASMWIGTGAQATDYLVHYGAQRDMVFTYPFTSVKRDSVERHLRTAKERQELRTGLGLLPKEVASSHQEEPSYLLLSVGQFIPRKGFDILFEAVALLPEQLRNVISVCIIGGTPTEDYRNQIERLGLSNIFFPGMKTWEELKEYYLAADLFVLPTREDIWGLVVNESLALGLPVVTTNRCVAGMEMIGTDGPGELVPIENATALASAIENYLEAEDSYKDAMRTKALETAEEYTIENMAARHLELFELFLEKMV